MVTRSCPYSLQRSGRKSREDVEWSTVSSRLRHQVISTRLGTDPRGLVLYHPSGLLWAQVLAGTAAPWVPYLGYVGTWAIREASMTADGARGVVEHRIESATLPELLEGDPARPFTVSDDKLTLGDEKTYRRHFRRVTPAAV